MGSPSFNNLVDFLVPRFAVNQIRATTVNGSTGTGIPKHVTNVQTAMANAAAGATSTVTVTFQRDPTDTAFAGVQLFVKGYQGNQTPVMVAQSTESPAKFILNNTGESVSVIAQAYGNGGNAPLASAPTTGIKLPKSASGGFGSGSSTTGLQLKHNGVLNGLQTLLNLKNGSNVSITDDGVGGVTITVTIPNLPASIITSGLLALARGGTNADLSATGGTSQVLKQVSSGAAVTVGQLAASDLSNGTDGSGKIILASASTGTGNSVRATGPSVTGLTSDTQTLTAAAPTVAAAQVGLGATTASSATAGSNGDVPAQVVGYLIINVAGTAMKIPYYNT